ncbi:PREDICTED: cytochrome P450 4C1-like [Vollenhovia emeryi]|uniref:cytochrome P450 4C1-like n=1 Tax=Vollenhovia emeryi TaxID=411798 RepID=UPI0005F473D5|nr:PREDICTED: cytochrome P450 4C1-like [Vollenhovia emeryi]
MTQFLKDVNNSNIDDLTNFISHHTLNAICETAMGTLMQNMGEFQQRYRQAIHEMGNIVPYRVLRPWFHPDIIFALTPMGKKHAKNLKILHRFTEKIIAERKQYHENTGERYLKFLQDTDEKETEEKDTIEIKKKRLAMLDLLIAAAHNNEINDSDIREEVDTFMFEERVRNEVRTVMHENGGKLTMTVLNNLHYLERCIKETLRLYPSVPLISRVLSEDIKMQSYLVPSGAVIQINIYDIHRDPNFWSDPDIFDPDRFLPDRIINRHPYSYLPFSAGSRNCIGQRFAILEMKAVIASLVQDFYLEPVDHLKDLRFMLDIICRVVHPIRVRFVPIEHLFHQQTMIITILLLLSFIVLVYNYYVHRGKNGRLINLIPGRSGYPIIGNVLEYLDSREDLWKILVTLSNQYYPIYKSWGFFTPVVVIRHPDDLQAILSSSKHIDKSILYDVLYPWFGTGLITSKGIKWHSRRQILTSAFHFNILKQFVEILIEEGEHMTKSLKSTGGTVVDLEPFISEHTLNAICETAMGTPLQGLGAFQQEYRRAVHRMGELLTYRLFRQWLQNDWIFSLTPKGREQIKTLKTLHGFTERIIAERKLYHERTNGRYLKSFRNDTLEETNGEETINIRKRRLAMLDLLIAASREGLMTDLDIREEVDTFMFAGHDTTAMSLCYTLALLAEHKDIQDRVRNEINIAMQQNGEKFTMKLLQNLSYLDRCVKEALRLYPSVSIISRISTEDVQLQSYLVPARTILDLNIYGVHRDPNFWPNPDTFDPDRFLPEKIKNRHPYSYIPFSAGPRNCIGQRYAMLELKAMIAPLVQNFYLEPVDYLKDLRIHIDLILRPAHPVRIRFVPICKMSEGT